MIPLTKDAITVINFANIIISSDLNPSCFSLFLSLPLYCCHHLLSSYHILPQRILSCRNLSLSCPILSYLLLLHLFTSYSTLFNLITSSCIPSYPIPSHPILLYSILSYLISSYLMLLYAMLYYAMLYYTILCYAILCYPMLSFPLLLILCLLNSLSIYAITHLPAIIYESLKKCLPVLQ